MIRPYDPTDEDDLIRVFLASTIPGQPFLPETHWRAIEPMIREFLPVAKTWVVDEDGELVAFISLLEDMIGGLFTHPDHQGKGHGRTLVEHAHERHDPLFVEVFEANEAAQGFYRSLGFVAHTQHIDETTGLTALVLRLSVTSAARAAPESSHVR
jgi:putative acetyltransferase